MSKIFVTSDTHFGHDREFVWGPRGFTNYVDHDNEVIRRWNAVVGPDDIVYHLGDVMLGDNAHGMDCLRQLNGTIYIIPGNHDTSTRIKLYKTLENVHVFESNTPGFEAAAATFKYKKYNFYLSHHPTMTSNLEKAPYLRMHLINLFGHTHQQNKFFQGMPFMFHVGMDSNNCTPVLLDDAIEMMKAETQICIDMLDIQKQKEEAESGCGDCAHQNQCSASLDGKRCKDYLKDELLSTA